MMSVNRLLSNSRHLLGRNAAAAAFRKAGEGARGGHVMAVPPRNKVRKGEMAVMGVTLVGAIWFVPFWVLYHLPDYQKEDRNQYTGK